LLRRGAGVGWAKVDFAGHDGNAYRACWSVRRARSQETEQAVADIRRQQTAQQAEHAQALAALRTAEDRQREHAGW